MDEKDCAVCNKLVKEKHRNIIWWKIACVFFAALSIILAIFYFGSGKIVKETKIEVEHTEIVNDGDSGTIIIGDTEISDSYNGSMKEIDYTPIVCITGIICVAVLIVSGLLIVNHYKKYN